MKGFKHVLTALFALFMLVGFVATPVEAAAPASEPQQYGCTYYRVVWGDTLSRLAVRFRTTVYQIQRANGLYGTRIYAGNFLCIPRYAPAPPPWPYVGPPRPPRPSPQPQVMPAPRPGPFGNPWGPGYGYLPGLQGPPGTGWPAGPGGPGGWPPRR